MGSLAYEFHPKKEAEFYRDESVKGLIARIEGHKVRVREIESEIETIKGEERKRTSERPGAVQEQHPWI